MANFDQKPMVPPYRGIVSSTPKPYTPPNSFDDILNFFLYRGRIITRNKSVSFAGAPDGSSIYNLIPFNDILLNPHNLILTALNVYMMTRAPGGTTPPGFIPVWNGPLPYPDWDGSVTYVAGDVVNFFGTTYVSRTGTTNNQPDQSPTQWAVLTPATVDTGNPWSFEISNGRVFFSNGSRPGSYSDGEATIKSMRHPGSFFFIGQLAQHMITANTIEPAPQVPGSIHFPARVRWSNVGDPTDWVEGASSSAGHQDLIDVPDQITGYATQGRTGFVYRTNGISMMTPTGIGAAPFQFDQVTHAPKGVGNFYPYSMDVWGTTSFFVSEDDVYTFDASSFRAIGADAHDRIFADIGASPANQIIGSILVRFNANFLIHSYWLSCPSSAVPVGFPPGPPVVWIYFADTHAWVRFNTTVGPKRVTAIGQLVV